MRAITIDTTSANRQGRLAGWVKHFNVDEWMKCFAQRRRMHMTPNELEPHIASRLLPGTLRIIDHRHPELERAWQVLRTKRGLDDGYTERCMMTGEDWEYMGTCIPADDGRLIVHAFRHRCATASKNGAREFNRSHTMHADRSIYINIPASAKYTREVQS